MQFLQWTHNKYLCVCISFILHIVQFPPCYVIMAESQVSILHT
jgi:hypothetical protein